MMDFPQHILNTLEGNVVINSLKLSEDLNETHQKIVGAIKSLESLGNVRPNLINVFIFLSNMPGKTVKGAKSFVFTKGNNRYSLRRM